ncbi:hypothetical protein [Pseudomonas sp. C9-3]|uniref:hypothetical protein n=1 Tax=Pseudomonas sp. C9-3 TaxID=3078264 RepID=UPI0028EB52E7|nr:hypothetical protein [Pseudomonas sp. C9-3]
MQATHFVLNVTNTERGFPLIQFKDLYGCACTLQLSSLVEPVCVWFGPSEHRMHLSQAQAAELLPYLVAFIETGDLTCAPAAPEAGTQQLFAGIRPTSKYAAQINWCEAQGYGHPFRVELEPSADGYVVIGGAGGRYRLDDVHLYAKSGDDLIQIR